MRGAGARCGAGEGVVGVAVGDCFGLAAGLVEPESTRRFLGSGGWVLLASPAVVLVATAFPETDEQFRKLPVHLFLVTS